jgi:hypothetical protein
VKDDDGAEGHAQQKPLWQHTVAAVVEEDTIRDGDEAETKEAVGDALRVVEDSGGGVGDDTRQWWTAVVAGACDDALDGDCTCTALRVVAELS